MSPLVILLILAFVGGTLLLAVLRIAGKATSSAVASARHDLQHHRRLLWFIVSCLTLVGTLSQLGVSGITVLLGIMSSGIALWSWSRARRNSSEKTFGVAEWMIPVGVILYIGAASPVFEAAAVNGFQHIILCYHAAGLLYAAAVPLELRRDIVAYLRGFGRSDDRGSDHLTTRPGASFKVPPPGEY